MRKIFKSANIFDAKSAEAYLSKLISKKETFAIETVGKQRTLDQNDLFHLWVKVVADEIGEPSFERCKRDIKRMILGMKEDVNRFTGEVIHVDYKTSEMSVSELSSFMDKMKIWAQTELGCYLPYWKDPGYEEMVSEYKYKK